MMHDHDTIAAPATAAGGAIAVIRVSGPDALAVCGRLFRGRRPLTEAGGYTVHYGRIVEPAPASGEDLAPGVQGVGSGMDADAAGPSSHVQSAGMPGTGCDEEKARAGAPPAEETTVPVRPSAGNGSPAAATTPSETSESIKGPAVEGFPQGRSSAAERIVDDVLAAVFRAPHSYTGEDSVEISCHGSQYVVSEILRLLTAAGARMAEPGEFTVRAYLNGKMDLAQAEAVADLIASSSRAAHTLAANQLRGGYSEALDALRDKLLELASLLELELDFSEEEVEFADREQLRLTMERIAERIDRLRESFTLGNAIKQGVAVAIAGAPNVGKSTLLNRLLGEERALVSDIAGTTRDVIEETANIGGVLFRFLDTAGIRATGDRLERMGIERSLSTISRARIIIRLLDATKLARTGSDRPPQTVSGRAAGDPAGNGSGRRTGGCTGDAAYACGSDRTSDKTAMGKREENPTEAGFGRQAENSAENRSSHSLTCPSDRTSLGKQAGNTAPVFERPAGNFIGNETLETHPIRNAADKQAEYRSVAGVGQEVKTPAETEPESGLGITSAGNIPPTGGRASGSGRASDSDGLPTPDFPVRPDQRLLTVVNKCDKAPCAPLPAGAIGISAKNGDGIDTLRAALRAAVDTEALYHGDAVVSSSRHYEALTEARDALRSALDGLCSDLPTDLLSEEVRRVIRHIGHITGRGEIAPDEILQTIFSKFCIGK